MNFLYYPSSDPGNSHGFLSIFEAFVPIINQLFCYFFRYLVESGIGNPSKAQVNCGGGFPVATHFNEIGGPGCNVCSEKEYVNSGLASEIK